VSPEMLLEVVRDATAREEDRVAAVVALSESASRELSPRVRVAADAVAAPRVRVALDAALRADDAALLETLEACDDRDAGARD